MVDDSLGAKNTGCCDESTVADTVNTVPGDDEKFVDVSALTNEERQNLSVVYYEIGGRCPGGRVRATTLKGLSTVGDMMGGHSVDVSRACAVAVVNNDTRIKVRIDLDQIRGNGFKKARTHR